MYRIACSPLPLWCRWSEATRDEVLARLLELNRQRAAEERRTGATAGEQARAKGPRKPKGPKAGGPGPGLEFP